MKLSKVITEAYLLDEHLHHPQGQAVLSERHSLPRSCAATYVEHGTGAYVLGWTRVTEGLSVRLYEARTGAELGTVTAHPYTGKVRVELLRIWPPGENSLIQIGRYFVTYRVQG